MVLDPMKDSKRHVESFQRTQLAANTRDSRLEKAVSRARGGSIKQFNPSLAEAKSVAPIGFITAGHIGIVAFMKMVLEVLWMSLLGLAKNYDQQP